MAKLLTRPTPARQDAGKAAVLLLTFVSRLTFHGS